jgi:hypothetical protein
MAKVLLSLHVLAGIIFIGPVTVAVSLFPRYARLAADLEHRASVRPVLTVLRRISTAYAVLGISVPVFGLGVALQLGVLTDAWVVVSIGLTLAAAAVLVALVLPTQRTMLDVLDDPTSPLSRASLEEPERRSRVTARWVARTKRLAGLSGVFALIWAVVVVLMIVRPGSTTGV